MKRISSYRILRSIYIEGLGEFRKGSTASLSKEEAEMFPPKSLEKESDYLQGFDDEAAIIEWKESAPELEVLDDIYDEDADDEEGIN